MMRFLYLIGYPGSGKTTVMRHALSGTHAKVDPHPFAHTWRWTDGATPIVELGKARDGGFGGTDALAMNATTRVEGWLDAMMDDIYYVVGEGDRLATDRFFEFCTEHGELTVALIKVSPEFAAWRCQGRGSNQNESWWKGRVTKVDRLAEAWVQPEWVLDGTQPREELARRIREHPVFTPLTNVEMT